jgi:hypothetical protein
MEDQKLTPVLKQLATQRVPDTDLWSAINTQLTSRPKTAPARLQLSRFAIATVTALLLVTAALAVTPWGQAVAQSFLKFFVPAAESYPLSPEEIATGQASVPTIAPTFAAQLVTIEGPAPTATALAPSEGCETDSTFPTVSYCGTVSLAETIAGFEAKEPPTPPFGLTFVHASADSELHKIALVYTCSSGGCQFFISQSKGPQPVSEWDKVPPEAVKPVMVNGQDGEYVAGGFVLKPNATEVTWEPGNGTQRLRWQEGEYQFEIAMGGHPEGNGQTVDKAALIALAESLMANNATTVVAAANADQASIETAEAQAGFTIKQLTVLPEGFQFSSARFVPEAKGVWLVYAYEGNTGDAAIQLWTTRAADAPGDSLANDFPPEALQAVEVSGYPAEYAEGRLNLALDGIGPGTPTPAPNWVYDRNRTLAWSDGELRYTLFFFVSDWYGGELSKADMIAMAESLK